MRISLVYPPHYYKLFEENTATVTEEFGVYPPMSLGYLKSLAIKAGHQVQIIDTIASKLTKKETLKKIKRFNPDIILVSLHSTYRFWDCMAWIRYFKKYYDKPILVGGHHFDLYTEDSMQHPEFDFGIRGSSRTSLTEFLKCYEKGEDYTHIKGMCYRKNGKIIINPNASGDDIELLPFPDLYGLPHHRYCQFISKKKNFTIMFGGMSCPFKCTFCAVKDLPYTERSAESVVAEVEHAYHKYGVREIDFFDPIFTVNKKRVIKFCKLLRKRKLDLVWSCRSRIDTVNEEVLREMGKAGCIRILYGIESVSPEVLKKTKKELDLTKVEKIINLTNKFGIMPLGFFMIGNPGDTKKSVLATIKFAKKLKINYVQVSKTVPKPKTELDDQTIQMRGRDYWKEYILGQEIERCIPSPWCKLSDNDKEYLTKLFYKRFYLRPTYILRTLLSLGSFEELKRYITAAIKMLFSRRVMR